MRAVLVLVLAFWMGPAHATEIFVLWRDSALSEITMPSNRWLLNPPLAPIHVWPADREFVGQMCSTPAVGHNDIGCAALLDSGHSRACMIYIDKNLDPVTYGAVLRHEGAHCRGWPGDHPVD